MSRRLIRLSLSTILFHTVATAPSAATAPSPQRLTHPVYEPVEQSAVIGVDGGVIGIDGVGTATIPAGALPESTRVALSLTATLENADAFNATDSVLLATRVWASEMNVTVDGVQPELPVEVALYVQNPIPDGQAIAMMARYVSESDLERQDGFDVVGESRTASARVVTASVPSYAFRAINGESGSQWVATLTLAAIPLLNDGPTAYGDRAPNVPSDNQNAAAFCDGTPFSPPIAQPIVSPGRKTRFRSCERLEHFGIDLRAAEGTAVMAVDDGTVIMIANQPCPGCGTYVVVQHSGGRGQTQYCHLKAGSPQSILNVQCTAPRCENPTHPDGHAVTVTRGQQIALSGVTGTECRQGGPQPHLHLTYAPRGTLLGHSSNMTDPEFCFMALSLPEQLAGQWHTERRLDLSASGDESDGAECALDNTFYGPYQTEEHDECSAILRFDPTLVGTGLQLVSASRHRTSQASYCEEGCQQETTEDESCSASLQSLPIPNGAFSLSFATTPQQLFLASLPEGVGSGTQSGRLVRHTGQGICSSGLPFPSYCSNNSECRGFCDRGMCVMGTRCTSDAQCERCEGGVCSAESFCAQQTSQANCDAGHCDIERGRCSRGPSCVVDPDCPGSCVKNYCESDDSASTDQQVCVCESRIHIPIGVQGRSEVEDSTGATVTDVTFRNGLPVLTYRLVYTNASGTETSTWQRECR